MDGTVHTGPAVEVVHAGPLSTVQDLGRPGWAHLGVPRSGALDAPALRWANRLVGNAEDAAGIETTVGGCVLRCTASTTVAVTGAVGPVLVDGRPVSWGLPASVPAGGTVTVGAARCGVRSYVALAGGVDVPPVLGSRSTDTLSGLGPAPLADGDRLPLGRVRGVPAVVDVAPQAALPDPIPLHLRLGPRHEWFTPAALRRLVDAEYVLSARSDRVGARLDGPPLERAREEELPSEGVTLGALQVPTDGHPVLFLADHPTTGGYPVIAVVDAADVPLLAQAPPGSRIRFTTARGGRR